MKRARAIYRDGYSSQHVEHERDRFGRIVRTWKTRLYRGDAPGFRAWARRRFADTEESLSPKLLTIVVGGAA